DMRECSIVIDDERVLSRHARVYQDSFGRWYIEQAAAGAEIWAQVRSIRFGVGACFQCGEQRFVVRTI
ncbi:MAG: FHA domain-containing protein, partial [Pirellulales bacterium]